MPGTSPAEDRQPRPESPRQRRSDGSTARVARQHGEPPPVTVTVVLPEHPPALTSPAAAALLAFLKAERAQATGPPSIGRQP